METQVRAKRLAPLARCEFFDFREEFGGHSRGGEKAKIAAARLRCLILGGFRGELRQSFSVARGDRPARRSVSRLDSTTSGGVSAGAARNRCAARNRTGCAKSARRAHKNPGIPFRSTSLSASDLLLDPLTANEVDRQFSRATTKWKNRRSEHAEERPLPRQIARDRRDNSRSTFAASTGSWRAAGEDSPGRSRSVAVKKSSFSRSFS